MDLEIQASAQRSDGQGYITFELPGAAITIEVDTKVEGSEVNLATLIDNLPTLVKDFVEKANAEIQ